MGGLNFRDAGPSPDVVKTRPAVNSEIVTRLQEQHRPLNRQQVSSTQRTPPSPDSVTGTTRSDRTGAGEEEDITIKSKGQGTIKIGGTEIGYNGDTELNIRRGDTCESKSGLSSNC